MTQLCIVEAGPVPVPALSQYFTPPELASELARSVSTFLRIRPDARLLEPSAGLGALVRAVLAVAPRAHIDAVDIDARWVAELEGLGPNVRAEHVDYLERPAPAQRYHLALTNPPYDGGEEAAHLEKLLDECERILAILPARSLHGRDRYARIWSRFGSEWWLRQMTHCIARPRFGEGGGKDEVVLLDLQRNVPGDCRVRWI